MNIAIIDDLEDDLLLLSDIVTTFYNEQNTQVTISHFPSGEDFLKTYLPGKYQLIFLDIYMDQLTGMDVAEKIRAASDSCALIFISSSDTHAVSSYDVQATYYLLKPVDKNKLYRVLTDLKIKDAQESRYFEVISERTPVRIPIRSILYVDTFRNTVQFHTDAGLIRTYLTFQKFEEMSAGFPNFLSCYRGCIVNMDRINKALEDGFLMDNHETVLIRKRGANTIKKEYLHYLFSNENMGA